LDRMREAWSVDWSSFRGQLHHMCLISEKLSSSPRGIRFVEVYSANSSNWVPAEVLNRGYRVAFYENAEFTKERIGNFTVLPPVSEEKDEKLRPALRLLLPDIAIIELKFKSTYLAKISRNSRLAVCTKHRVAFPRVQKVSQLNQFIKKFLDIPKRFDQKLLEYQLGGCCHRGRCFDDLIDVSRMRKNRLPTIEVRCVKDEMVCVLHTQVGRKKFRHEYQNRCEIEELEQDTRHIKRIVCVKAKKDTPVNECFKIFQESIFEARILSSKLYVLYAIMPRSVPTKKELGRFHRGSYRKRKDTNAFEFYHIRRTVHFICRFVPLGDPLKVKILCRSRFSAPIPLTLEMQTVQNIQDLLVCASQKLDLDQKLKLEPIGLNPAAKAALRSSLCTKLMNPAFVASVKKEGKARSSVLYLNIELISIPRINPKRSSQKRKEMTSKGADDLWEEMICDKYDHITSLRRQKKKRRKIIRKSAINTLNILKGKRSENSRFSVSTTKEKRARRKKSHRSH